MVVGFMVLSLIWGFVTVFVLWLENYSWWSLLGVFAGPFETIIFLSILGKIFRIVERKQSKNNSE